MRNVADLVISFAEETATIDRYEGNTQLAGTFSAAENQAYCTVCPRRHFEQTEGLHDRTLRQYLLKRKGGAKLRQRVVRGMPAAFHRDAGDVGARCAGFVHVANRVEGVPRYRREPERGLEVDVADDAQRVVHGLGAVSAALDRHAECEREVRAPQQHVRRGLVKREPAGDAHFLHLGQLGRAAYAELCGHVGRETQLARRRRRHREHGRADVGGSESRIGQCVEYDPGEDVVIEALGELVATGREAANRRRACRDDRDFGRSHA